MKRLLAGGLAAMGAVAALAALSVWLIARDDVAAFRAIAAHSAPLPPHVRNAILAAEDPIILQPARASLRHAFASLSPRMRSCGPSPIAYMLVRPRIGHVRPLRRHLEAAVRSFLVGRLFTAEELLRIYAHELYLGTWERRQIVGVDAASAFYFGKSPRALTAAEAATLGAMIRAPNVYSPLRDRERALTRRNQVLERMLRFHYIDAREYERARREPLRAAA
ncbi:MAG TPA: transglycosylase domain-containing protein [Thermoanaerobaculia bacterium]|jgi:membrane peptidoglycan carboxypeptidase